MRLVIVSGRSGSGKSTALNMLEDQGYYCVDNLPVGLMPQFAKHALDDYQQIQSRDAQGPDANFPGRHHIAIGIDARNMASNLNTFPELVKQMPDGIEVNIIFLDADDSTLLKRFSETRRKHPLSGRNTSLNEALAIESQRLESIANMADLSIDTSAMTLHQLREFIRERVGSKSESSLALMFQSFGFKRSVPIDSDLVFDVRCLPNPHWHADLRPHTGNEKPVIDFLESQPDVIRMLDDIINYLEHWLPAFEANNRSYLTVSIGCTGGKHRSVFLSNRLQAHFSRKLSNVQVRHRELIQTDRPHD